MSDPIVVELKRIASALEQIAEFVTREGARASGDSLSSLQAELVRRDDALRQDVRERVEDHE